MSNNTSGINLFVGELSNSPNMKTSVILDIGTYKPAEVAYVHAVEAPDAALQGLFTALPTVFENTGGLDNVSVGIVII